MTTSLRSLDNAAEPFRPPWLPRSSFPFSTRFVDIDGQLVHYVDEGTGPTLLFVSAGQWAFMFRDVITRLREQFRCVTLDFPGCGLSPDAADHSVAANARVLTGFIGALDLQDITMVVHDVGGPIGLLVAAEHPQRFGGLVISNTFAWPLADYPAIRRTLKVVGGRLFGGVNRVTNVLALVTATSYGVGRAMSRADRRSFRGPWRSRDRRVATQQILAGAGRIDPIMKDLEARLRTVLAEVPVLTIFGRKNDPFGWQRRFQQLFPAATAVAIEGRHFPFDDDPDAYSAAIRTWWTATVVPTTDRSVD